MLSLPRITVKEPPETHEFLYNHGLEYTELGNYRLAFTCFFLALDRKPDFYEALFNCACVMYYNGDNINWVIKDFTGVLRIKPDFFEALHNRGYAYLYKDDYDSAIADFTEALSIRPDCAHTLYYRGTAYYGKGDYERTIADWEAVLRIDQNYPEAGRNIEWVRQMLGNNK